MLPGGVPAEGMVRVADLEEAAAVLLPQTAETRREFMSYTFVKPPKGMPSCLLQDFIEVSWFSACSNVRIFFFF